MLLVRVKEKFQVTIPTELREHAGLNVGDYLEAAVAKGGVITLTPKGFVDRRIAEGLADMRAGRVHGPYATVDEAMTAMKQQVKSQGRVKDRRSR